MLAIELDVELDVSLWVGCKLISYMPAIKLNNCVDQSGPHGPHKRSGPQNGPQNGPQACSSKLSIKYHTVDCF